MGMKVPPDIEAEILRRCGVKPAEPIAPPPDCDEKTFMARVIALAESLGYLVYHTHNSRRSEPGFPDLCMVGGERWANGVCTMATRLIFAELKSETGKETAAQRKWRRALEAVPGVEVFLWRPSDLATIEELLK